MNRLSSCMLDAASDRARRPAFDPAALRTGIVHLGMGAFQRAHMAAYTQPLLVDDPSWGVMGASLRSNDTRAALMPQDWLYALCERGNEGDAVEVMGGLTGVLGPDDTGAFLRHLVAPSTRIASLTVTEKGYIHAADGGLDADDSRVRADLAGDAAPRTVPGLIVEALRQRRAAGLAPFTVLSCDNLPANGATTRRILCDYARLREPGLEAFVQNEVSCPDTMVDRIVPATTAEDRQLVAELLGLEDSWPVMAEPFRQWVIEDRFGQGRPRWEETGAIFVADVRPWEEMKLRLLNGSHSTIAYLGLLAGWETVADAMAASALAAHVEALMRESATTLRMPAGTDVAAYGASLAERFRNRSLRHRTRQIASDGSQKMPQRLLMPGAERAAAGGDVSRIALGVAAWLRVAGGRDDRGGPLSLDDPMAATLQALAEPGQGAARIAERLFVESGLVPAHARHPALQAAVADALEHLARDGAVRTLERLNEGGQP